MIPDYELLRLIGRGAYGEVWLARGVTGIYRAVKLVWRDRFPEAGPYEREFHGLKEFAAISLSESRQLALLHVGRDPAAAYFYYVMELADDVTTGREIDPANYTPHTLKEVRSRRGRLPAGECIALGVELARALSGLHARGLVHRDIKPSNVIIVGGAPKLADIGLVTEASAALTFVGTEGFVPPEGPGAPSADVFALGKLLYELATGLDRHDYPRLPPELHTWPDRKEALELNEVLIHACEPHPDQRHLDAAALLDDLLLLQAGKSVRRLRKAERRLARALRIAAVLALIAGVAGLGAYLERQRANEEMVLRAKAEAERDVLARRRTYSGNLASAQRAIDTEDFSRARRLLQELSPKPGQEDLRRFEWQVLRRLAQGDPHHILRENGPGINRLFLSQDETCLAAHDSMAQLTVYDTNTLKPLWVRSDVTQLAGLSSDGNWLLGLDSNLRFCRWSLPDGSVNRSDFKIAGRVIALGGRDEVFISTDHPAQVVAWADGREVWRVPIGDSGWVVFRSAGDARQLVLACVRGTGSNAEFQLSCLEPGAQPRLIQAELGRQRPSTVGVDSQGAWAAMDTTGRLWRCLSGQWQETGETLPPGTRRYQEVTSANPPQRIAAHSRELTWFAPPAMAGRPKTARGHGSLITDIAIASIPNAVFSASADGGIFAWPLQGPAPVDTVFRAWDFNAGSTKLVFAPDGKSLWVALDGKSCGRLDLASFQISSRIEGMLYPVKLTPQGLLGVGHATGLIWANPETGKTLPPSLSLASPIRVLASTADGRRGALIDRQGRLHALEEKRGATSLQDGFERYYCLTLDEPGEHCWLTNGRELLCLEWPTGRELWRTALPATASSFVLTAGAAQLVIALENGNLEIYAAGTGLLFHRTDSGSAAPQALALSPDGRRLFVGGLDGDIHCFDPGTWDEVFALSLGARIRLHHLACSPDGQTLAALSKTGELRVLRTDSGP